MSQVLLAQHIDATIIDSSAERVRQAARFGFRIYFGDGTRRDVLRAAGAEQATIICVCVAKARRSPTASSSSSRPNSRTQRFSCAPATATTPSSCSHKGVDYEMRETFESALAFGAETLRGIGFAADEADTVVAEVRRRDAERLAVQLGGEADRRCAGGEAERS